MVPFSPMAVLPENPYIGVREQVINEIMRSDQGEIRAKLDSVIPPDGPMSFWDPHERIYRTRYMRGSADGRPRISKSLVDSKSLWDIASFYIAAARGEIIPFLDTTIEWIPPDQVQPWAYEFTYPGKSIAWRLSIVYRGCPEVYEYPFRPSVFRRFRSPVRLRAFDGLKTFIHNLIVELTWCGYGVALYPNESEAIIQHYKLLPWTYLTDASYDINIAKAFACSLKARSARRTPALYKIVLLNVDYYNMGAHFLEHLPFRRPQLQKAISIVGLDRKMQDPAGYIVALTEHPLYYSYRTTGWDSMGGDSLVLGGQSFDSPLMEKEEYDHLQALLYPQEPDDVRDLFRTITRKVQRCIDGFGLSGADQEAILHRFAGLERELDARIGT